MNDLWKIALAVMVALPLVTFKHWKEEKGAELVEFAVVVPLLMMVLFGMFWFARAFNINETMNRAAREGAVYGSRPHCALCGGGGVLGQFPITDDIGSKVIPSLNAAHIKAADLASIPKPDVNSCARGSFDPTSPCPVSGSRTKAGCETPAGPANGKIWVCRCVDMTPNIPMGNQECGVSVTMAYPWKFTLPFSGIGGKVYTMTASSAQRQEF